MTAKGSHILSPKEDDAIKRRRGAVKLGQGVAPTTAAGIVLFQTRNKVND